jgi:hypothetical protein
MQRRTPRQTHLDPALSLVECCVRVSPTLARLIRKCALLEAGGASAHDALLASAGFQAHETETLRAQTKLSEEELKQAREREAQLQPALDQAKATIAQRDKELKDIHQILNKTAETEKGSRQSIEAFNRQVSELESAIAAYKEQLTLAISTDGLGEYELWYSASSKKGWPAEKASRRRHWVSLAIARSMWKPRSQNRTGARCAHSRLCSHDLRGASGSCCGYSERPIRDDGHCRLFLLCDRVMGAVFR